MAGDLIYPGRCDKFWKGIGALVPQKAAQVSAYHGYKLVLGGCFGGVKTGPVTGHKRGKLIVCQAGNMPHIGTVKTVVDGVLLKVGFNGVAQAFGIAAASANGVP